MKWTSLNELREKYLAFFESKGHLRLPSFSYADSFRKARRSRRKDRARALLTVFSLMPSCHLFGAQGGNFSDCLPL